MAKLLKLRRGTTTQHGSFTGAEGEVTIDTTKDTAVVHDGVQAGGRPLAREDMSNVSSASIAGRLGTDSISVDKIAAGTLPNDVKVNSGSIINQAIINEDVSNSAGIAGTKISPDFGTQDVVTTGNIDLSDSTGAGNNRIRLGTGDDLSFYHNGTDSHILTDTGNLDITCDSNQAINLKHGSEFMIRAITDGASQLYFDGVRKLETTSSGISVTGHINLPDQATGVGKLKIGDGNDLTLYHDGSHSYIANATNNLYINSPNFFQLGVSNGGDKYITATENGAVELYHDNVKKFETTSTGTTTTGVSSTTSLSINSSSGYIGLPDSAKIFVGTGNDLEIYHSSGYNIINTANAGNLDIKNGTEYIARFAPNGNNELFYDNSKKFETYASGVKFYGNQVGQTAGQLIQWQGANSNAFALGMTSGADSPTGSDEHLQFHHWNGSAWEKTFYVQRHNITIPDSNKIQFGDSGDLQIHHDGSNSYVSDSGTGELRLTGDSNIRMMKGTSETLANFTPDANCELFYDNSKKFETTSTGVKIPGGADIRGDHGNWTGEAAGKIQWHSNHMYLQTASNWIFRSQNGTERAYLDSNGNFVATGNVTAYSDARLKTDIHTINDALGICGKLRGVSYKWLENGKASIGVIAQEVEEILPEVVLTNVNTDPATGIEKEVKSVDYGKIVGVLINAINELKAEIDELKGGK